MRRSTFVRIVVAWTLVVFLFGILLVLQALWSLSSAQQACFANYPAVPCPGGDDPAVARLTFAFIGVPLVWAAGIAGLILRMRHRRNTN
jgi:hypothetical protein